MPRTSKYYMTTFWGRLLHTSWCWLLCVLLIGKHHEKTIQKQLVHWHVAFATSFILWLMEKPGFRPYTHHLDRRQGFSNRHHTRIDGRDLHFFFPWWVFCCLFQSQRSSSSEMLFLFSQFVWNFPGAIFCHDIWHVLNNTSVSDHH